MSLTVANLMQNLETFHGRNFETVFQKRPFTLLFHDTTKLRIRLETRDISVPLSILLFSILQLLTKKELTSKMCREILGKDWGFGYIAKILLECDDVCLKPDAGFLYLIRVRPISGKRAPVKPPPNGNHASRSSGNGSMSQTS